MKVKAIVPRSVRRSKLFQLMWGKWRDYRDERAFLKLSSSFTNLDQFIKYMEEINYHGFIQYHKGNPEGRRGIFLSLFNALDLDFKGSSFLDLGPGYGDSLDLAREGGATTVEFVDYDPYIAIFNTLKGFKGYRLNYTVRQGLNPLFPKKYNVILSKGSINSDQFNRKEAGMIPFPAWLTQLENLASPSGHVIICPTFDKGTKMCGASYYVCEDPESFRQSWFTKVLLDRNYDILCIKGFNEPVERFPFTFYKKFESLPDKGSNSI